MNGMTTAPTSIPQIKTEDVSNETIPVDAPPPTSLKKVSFCRLLQINVPFIYDYSLIIVGIDEIDQRD